jgi:predicted nucleic acid-binding protein
MSGVLVDTNVLVYAHDAREPAKQARAISVLEGLHASGRGSLSVQSLAEFFVATTRGASPRLKPAAAARQVELLIAAWPVLDLTPAILVEAGRGVTERKLSYFDAQLWATARLNQLGTVLSEDFPSGSSLDGVRFVNPFAIEFSLESWL